MVVVLPIGLYVRIILIDPETKLPRTGIPGGRDHLPTIPAHRVTAIRIAGRVIRTGPCRPRLKLNTIQGETRLSNCGHSIEDLGCDRDLVFNILLTDLCRKLSARNPVIRNAIGTEPAFGVRATLGVTIGKRHVDGVKIPARPPLLVDESLHPLSLEVT